VNRIIAWFVENPVAANLMMAVFLVGGVLALPAIRQEEFPSVDTDMIQVSVEYPGAAPEEIEDAICVRVEEEIEGTADIDRINTLAVEGACVVTVEMVLGSDVDAALSEIENRVLGITSFPEEAERPVISEVLIRSGVVQLAIAGDVEEETLAILGRQARDEIAALPGVSQAILKYVRPYEVSIEVSEGALRRHGLTLDQVATAVRRSSLDLPGGSVKTQGGEILLRTVGQAYRQGEFEKIAVLTRTDGTSVLLGEVAHIVDGFEDIDLRARFNGKPAVMVKIERIGEEDILDIARAVKSWLKGYRAAVPEGIELALFQDESEDLVVRFDALMRSARSGLILVLIVLSLFLRFRLAMWVAAGVPIALFGALTWFPALGITMSTLTVMAFILVLGILVDDAIVIGESVYSREQNSESQVQAAIKGTKDVYIPVIFGVMTSIAAFTPLIMVPGRMGRFFGVLGYTAILCLVFSLIESQLILPSHLAHRRISSKRGTPNAFVAGWQRFQARMAGGLESLARVRYGALLKRAIEFRYVTAAVAVGVAILTVALFSSGRMRYQFFPPIEGDVIYATLTMPQGVPLESTQAAVLQLERASEALDRELADGLGRPVIVGSLASIGEQVSRGGPEISTRVGGAHLAEIALELIPSVEREQTASDIANRWRELTGPIPDAVEVAFAGQSFSAGEDIQIELRGGDPELLPEAAAKVRERLARYRGVYDVADSFRAGKQELQLALLEDARPLGLTLQDLAQQVRQAFYGEEVQRVQRGRDDVRVMVRYPEEDRRSLGNLEEMRIRTGEGVEVPFAAVADAKLGRGYATIRRTDRLRTVSVTAAVDRSVATPEEITAEIVRELPVLLESYPGVSHRLGGGQAEHGDAVAGLIQGATLALLLIYALLAIPLKSYSQPLVIMSVIPFGAVGAILGHLVMGFDLVFFSLLGIVALSGVVVNGSLVMVHYVNRQRAAGVPVLDAVKASGVARFRPIVLTSGTTFIGLVPLMFESAVPARPLIPMAVSLAFGVLMSAIVTLLLVPCGYVILDDIARWLQGSRVAARQELGDASA
jgi:multidrug efflux pump subunit AcrB